MKRDLLKYALWMHVLRILFGLSIIFGCRRGTRYCTAKFLKLYDGLPVAVKHSISDKDARRLNFIKDDVL